MLPYGHIKRNNESQQQILSINNQKKLFVLNLNYSISYPAGCKALFGQKFYHHHQSDVVLFIIRCVWCVVWCVFVFYIFRYRNSLSYCCIFFFFFNFIFMIKYYYYGYGKNLIETKINNKTETPPAKGCILSVIRFVVLLCFFFSFCCLGIMYYVSV